MEKEVTWAGRWPVFWFLLTKRASGAHTHASREIFFSFSRHTRTALIIILIIHLQSVVSFSFAQLTIVTLGASIPCPGSYIRNHTHAHTPIVSALSTPTHMNPPPLHITITFILATLIPTDLPP